MPKFYISILLFLIAFNVRISYSQDIGTIKWTYRTSHHVFSSPCIGDDGTIYVGSLDKNLYAINPDGSLKWKFETNGKIYASPAVGEKGVIYFGSNDSTLYALNPDGTEKWKFVTEGTVSSPSIGIDGAIYVGSSDTKLYAFNPDGTKKWDYTTGGSLSGTSIGEDGTIHFYCDDKKMYAVNPNGTEKWHHQIENYFSGNPAIGIDGTIYSSSWNNTVYAFNPDGSIKWTYDYNSGKSAPCIDPDGTIYLGTSSGEVLALNPDGTKKWEYNPDTGFPSSPAIGADGIIYLGDYDNKFYAINPDGSLAWELELGYWVISSPTISKDGTVYVGCHDGKLYAINSSSKGLADSPWPKYRKNLKNTSCTQTLISHADKFQAHYTEDEEQFQFNLELKKTIDGNITIKNIALTDTSISRLDNSPISLFDSDSTYKTPFIIKNPKTQLYNIPFSLQLTFDDKNYDYTDELELALFVSDSSEIGFIGKQAVTAYNSSLGINSITAENNKGVIYRLLGSYDKAEEYFNIAVSKAIKQFYGYSGIKMNQGVVKSDKLMSNDAMSFYSASLNDISDNPDSSVLAPRIYYNQAWEYYQSNSYDDARLKIHATINHKKTNSYLKSKAYVLLGLVDVKRQDTTKAIQNFEYAINIDSASCIADLARENILLLNTDVVEKVTICEGENYQEFCESGQYVRKLESSYGTDSIVTTMLYVNPVYNIISEAFICNGETYNGWSSPGEYTQYLISSLGCDSTVTTNLNQAPEYNLSIDTMICAGSEFNGWSEPGEYIQNLTSCHGCDSTVTVNLSFTTCTGINIEKFYNFTLYPNPNNGNFKLKINNKNTPPFKIEIYNSIGQLILQKTFEGENEYDVHLGNVPKDIYLVKIKTKDHFFTKKIIISN